MFFPLRFAAELSSLMSLSSDFFNNASNSKVDLVDMSQKTRKSGVFTLLGLKETGRLQFISCFLQLLTLNRSIVCMHRVHILVKIKHLHKKTI